MLRLWGKRVIRLKLLVSEACAHRFNQISRSPHGSSISAHNSAGSTRLRDCPSLSPLTLCNCRHKHACFPY